MKKVFGHKTLVSMIITLWWVAIISQRNFVIITSSSIVVLLMVLFVPLIIFGETQLRILSFNPFGTRAVVPYSNISKATIHAGHFQCKLTLHLHSGDVVKTNSFFKYYDMEGLYQQFADMDIPITSTGVRAISWRS